MNTKHTPGKWIAVPNTSGSTTVQKPFLILEDKVLNAQNIASVIPCVGMPQWEVQANAKLIAAAPELLAALKEIIANPERVDKGSVAYEIGKKLPLPKRMDDDRQWYKQIISAVEKATL
ncbi:MAG: hypothetical protein IM569_13700 [Chitinophagaceae bacterium]|nr:hypothetical protein [Chitinophagaceae bacterium]